MRYVIDHDLHIHSQLSLCSGDPHQTPQYLLEYAKQNGLKKICVTDHFWDENIPDMIDWYRVQNFEHISQSKPLPQDKDVKFCFGCETDMDKNERIGISPARYGDMDFIIVPTTHMHMSGFTIDDDIYDSIEDRAELYVKRFERVLNSDLPSGKTGIAHLTCELMAGHNPDGEYAKRRMLAIVTMVSDDDYRRLFTRASEKNYGIEINVFINQYNERQIPIVLRPYQIAKECGCKFYLGSDGHSEREISGAMNRFNTMIDLLGLTEDDKYDFVKNL